MSTSDEKWFWLQLSSNLIQVLLSVPAMLYQDYPLVDPKLVGTIYNLKQLTLSFGDRARNIALDILSFSFSHWSEFYVCFESSTYHDTS